MRQAKRALAAPRWRRQALRVAGYTRDNALGSLANFATESGVPHAEEEHTEVALPSHIKFRMPDLDFKEVGSGAGDTTLTKWYVQEGSAVKDGTHMCEIDTPDLCFQLESGDEGFVARLLVNEGSNNIAAGQPIAIIVPTEGDIEPFVKVLKENPRSIEGYVESVQVAEAEVVSTSSTAPPTESAASSDVLRMLNKLQKEGLLEDEKALKVLKSLARKNDEQLLTTYKASYEDGVLEETAFDKAFFVENALELAEEAAGASTSTN
ncbi:Dihydrolipoyllysine-residue acetyltransferase component 1 of pyruvate dehydrogenase complex [Phytophthora citrophthora]|uniref:Dihydrolipoyllysine-residue acetyltransferase component 1 of pyruvate dehydrogenase complex n=1 Tax=Phytophthora citrophthora TaxID=4793 RepID=A0AAD9FYP8_9STRA|nr:Dihydrolipoyllysine-residue acetyltransferase component 1 of pyruvate dehydrogenase complex [Phytophthora citrophthora]